jgi:dTDP-4-amino-4,6-dideoxy-D-glucose ammonia-lyase
MNKRLGYTHNYTTIPDAGITHLDSVSQSVCKLLANDPFIRASDICKQLGISVDNYIKLSKTIRSDSSAQNYILYQGHGTKYWSNTIGPLLESGSLHTAINRTYMYPNRVGLYTGMSCMFYCNFCGRNPVAEYSKELNDSSFNLFKQIIDQDPRTDLSWPDRFRISGGLEPLTNSNLGRIITYGRDQGYKMQLYTNGYMMTERYLTRHPGMLDLYAVRFSLYGVDAESAFRVTRHPKSFDNIIANIINYLNQTTDTRVGVNWIVLPGHANDVIKLIDIIQYINQTATRPVDFVTLREDFSQNIRVISDPERKQLMQIFQKIENMRQSWPTHWDFGYSLESLDHGRNSGQLRMVNWQQMIPEGFPQVSVAVDVKGDVYNYHESGFLDRPGASRYIIGNIQGSSVEEQVQNWISKNKKVRPLPPDIGFLDAFDHVVSELIIQAREDEQFGVSWEQGPVACRQ